jgi:hypothetical protein
MKLPISVRKIKGGWRYHWYNDAGFAPTFPMLIKLWREMRHVA